ncbi:MAG: 16S rRNA (uracil(1498)-N(3))-methyltransferase [Firmicutes bacterium]|nr:16S rRNA (uracil(1498)-N(3))-methyltransferase [Bacillota bacterium]
MGLARFYIPQQQIQGNRIELTESVYNHAVKVLRMKAGDSIVLFDGTGNEYLVKLLNLRSSSIGSNHREVEIISVFNGRQLPEPRVYLCQAMIKKERWEWLLEKGTELGVYAFVPMITQYTEIEEKRGFEKKLIRWKTIVQNACEQSGRSFIPEILPPISFEKAIHEYTEHPLFFCSRSNLGQGSAEPVKSALSRVFPSPIKNSSVTLFIGPEGGFSEQEADMACTAKIPLISLGDQILRSETAGIAASIIMLFWFS